MFSLIGLQIEIIKFLLDLITNSKKGTFSFS